MVRHDRKRAGIVNRLAPAACVLACTILGGCASDTHSDRTPLAAPTGVSEIYSQANLQLMFATTASTPECRQSECISRVEFDRRVTEVGTRLSAAAYKAYPELAARIEAFNFKVVDKAELGAGSTAGGLVVVLRPVNGIVRSDEALAFVLGREIGHVVAQHHEENTATSIVISIVATVIAPVVNVAKLMAAVYSGASAAAASASVTAASFASSRVIIESYRPRQRGRADAIAKGLVEQIGYDARNVTAGFTDWEQSSMQSRWMRELQASVTQLSDLVKAADRPAVEKLALAR